MGSEAIHDISEAVTIAPEGGLASMNSARLW